MLLYIIRHGETQWNKVKRMQGREDIPLNEDGIRLAKETGEHMRGVVLDLIISSPLQRALETAKLVTAGRELPLLTDERLQEMSFGDWEGERILESGVIPPSFREQFYQDPCHCMRPPHGETFLEVQGRTGAFLKDLEHNEKLSNQRILISTHGAAGRCLLSHFCEDREDIWRGGVPANCSVCVVECIGGKRKVIEKDKIYQ